MKQPLKVCSAIMRAQFLAISICISSIQVAFAADPTFNGLLDLERCQFGTIVMCGEGYCVDVNPAVNGASIVDAQIFDFSKLTVGDIHPRPMQITDVSEPGLNKTLWVKFTFVSAPPNETKWNGMLVLAPMAGVSGGYLRKAGLVSEAIQQSEKPILHNASQILGGTCYALQRR